MMDISECIREMLGYKESLGFSSIPIENEI